MSPPERDSRPAGNGAAKSKRTGRDQDTATAPLLGEGAARRDEGMQLSLDALQPAWRSVAEETLDELIDAGFPFTTDDLRDRVGDPAGTGSARALGGMISGRHRNGEIVPVGYTTSRQPQRHGGILRIWQGAGL